MISLIDGEVDKDTNLFVRIMGMIRTLYVVLKNVFFGNYDSGFAIHKTDEGEVDFRETMRQTLKGRDLRKTR